MSYALQTYANILFVLLARVGGIHVPFLFIQVKIVVASITFVRYIFMNYV